MLFHTCCETHLPSDTGCCRLSMVLEAIIEGWIGSVGCIPLGNLISIPRIGCWIWLGKSLWIICPFRIQSGVGTGVLLLSVRYVIRIREDSQAGGGLVVVNSFSAKRSTRGRKKPGAHH